ncbi:MAG: GDSL-type esterase/lipase family protein [Fibrobacter sp.]|nr:GDSL-type esterase/lipase family protein [Fibrobacter sp.]
MNRIAKLALAAALFAGVAVSDSTSFTIHVIGDSTVCNYKDSAYPQTGWGQVLGYFFDGSRVKINNVAIGGRSSKKFINDGRLRDLEPSIQKGDYVFVQFGHNDRDYNKADRYTPIDSFEYYMKQYIEVTQKHGATPVLVSPMNMNGSRNIFSTGANNYDARGKMESLSKTYKIPFVDLNMKSYNTYNTTYKNIPDYVTTYLYLKLDAGLYPNFPSGSSDGNTHFQEMGSLGHCGMIVEELQDKVSASNLSDESKAAMTILVSAIKPRFNVTVKANISTRGLITQNQKFPAGTPMTLRVTPGNGETFEYWADDDCNKISSNKLYYGFKTSARNVTYTAMFKGGAACVATSHDAESSTSTQTSSTSDSTTEISSGSAELKYAQMKGTEQWPSLMDLSFPEEAGGTTDENHTGFVGNGFFNFANELGSTATYKMVSERSATEAKVFIRYSFDGASNRDMKVKIDAKEYDVVFAPTGSWDTWDTAYIEGVWLDACDFDMVFTSLTNDGGPNIDMAGFTNDYVYRMGSTYEPVGETQTNTATVATAPALKVDAARWTVRTNGGLLNVRVMNSLGKTVASEIRSVRAGDVNLLDHAARLPQGHYVVKISLDGKNASFVRLLK